MGEGLESLLHLFSRLLGPPAGIGTTDGELLDAFARRRDERSFELEGHTQRIISLAFSADGKFLVSGSQDASARVWNVSK